jgi:TfoX/Sxy family transcriptional regulator of competence genes
MNKKTVIITLFTLAALLFTLSCSRKMERSIMAEEFAAAGVPFLSEQSFDSAADTAGRARQSPAAASRSANSDGTDSISANLTSAERKLAKSAYLRIRVENLDTADASVTGLLQKNDAYAASTVVDENSRTYSLRVPAPRYDAFLAEMDGMGRLLHRSENTEDVTLRYYDLEGRLETKKELLKTFQSYLRTAKTIEEILAVEARISELQYDIEGTGMQFRHLANRVDYAAIDLYLVGPAAANQNRSETFGERIRQMFGGFGGFLSGVAIAIVGIIIYGIPILLLVVLFFWLLFGRIGLLKKLWRLVKGKKAT